MNFRKISILLLYIGIITLSIQALVNPNVALRQARDLINAGKHEEALQLISQLRSQGARQQADVLQAELNMSQVKLTPKTDTAIQTEENVLKVKNLETKVEELSENQKQLKEQLEKTKTISQEEKMRLEKELTELQEKHQQFSQQAQVITDAFNNTINSLKEAEFERDDCKLKFNQLKNYHDDFKKKGQQLFEEAEKEAEQEIENRDKKIQELQSKIDALQVEIAKRDKKIERLEAEITQIQNEFPAAKRRKLNE